MSGAINYKEDLAIDPDKLDEEWLRQPQLYQKYAEELENAERVKVEEKQRFEVVQAELDRDIRDDPQQFSVGEKMTEAVVKNTILLQEKYKNAQEKYNEAVHNVNILRVAVESFDQKKKSLENLVTLYIGKYFAGPKEPRILEGGKRLLDEKKDEVSREQREVLNAMKEDGEERVEIAHRRVRRKG